MYGIKLQYTSLLYILGVISSVSFHVENILDLRRE